MRAYVPALPRVFVHYLRQARQGRKLAAEAALYIQTRGYEVADIRRVEYPVSASRVRYFYPDDRAAAEGVAELLDRYLVLGPGQFASSLLQNYTHYRPLPSPGNIEVWIASTAQFR